MKRALRLSVVFFVAALVGCARDALPPAPAAPPDRGADVIELGESWPAETTLDHADVRDASAIWPEMIDRARRTLDVEQFYASGETGAPAKLEPSIAAVERAARRGVVVRFIVDEKLAKTYPETSARLARAGVEVRAITRFAPKGGVQHAKFFVVDHEEAWLGSQNFDWRSLEHIQALGVRTNVPAVAGGLEAIFERDWSGAPARAESREAQAIFASPAAAERAPVRVTFVASPRGDLPDEGAWDLPRIVRALDGAQKSVRVQVLTYGTKERDGSPFHELDDALRRAAARGVTVRLLVSSWMKGKEAPLVELAASSPNVEVRVLTIPRASSGEIPFARVVHAKYMVADDRVAWVGTSNWEGDYFTRSRNVGVVVEGQSFASRVARFFDDGWSSVYAARLAR